MKVAKGNKNVLDYKSGTKDLRYVKKFWMVCAGDGESSTATGFMN